jgi:MFS transporter, DHA1 family, inner membrane transport protein
LTGQTEGRINERFVLLTVIVIMTVNQTGIVIVSPLAVEIAREFERTVSAAGQLRTVAALVSGLLAPFVGLMSDRIGRRPVIFTGLAAMGACGLLSAVAPGFWFLLFVQVLAGVGIAALLSVGYAVVGDCFPPERRAWAVGIISIGQPMAWVFGLPLIGLITDNFGWRWSYIGVPVLFSLLGTWFALRLWLPPVRATAPRVGVGDLREILRNRSAASWIGCELLAYSGWTGSLVYLGAFYITVHGQSVTVTGFLLALAAVGFAAGSLLSHRVATRAGGKGAILGGGVLSAIALAIGLGFDMPVALAASLIALFGFAQGIRGAASSNLGLIQAPEHRGAMMGFRASVVQLGYVIGGVIGGVLLLVAGYEALGLVFGTIIIAAAVLMPLLVSDREAETRPAPA